MPTINIQGNIVTQTAAAWALDATVYSNKTILVTSDLFYSATDQPRFKFANGRCLERFRLYPRINRKRS
jgi:hypothetical protein